jgi:hypothetical protein
MFSWLRQRVLVWARVPPAPQPPFGAPESIRVFRAGRNHYRLSIVRWVFAQLATLAGILVSLSFLQEFKEDLREPPGPRYERAVVTEEPAVEPATDERSRPPGRRQVARQLGRNVPAWVVPLMVIGEGIGIAIYLLQLPLTFAALRLEYEQRWYIVTDRSLRIRFGIVTVRESTMSFANLQQVEVTQGPLQRLLGLADVRVQSAGGGGGRSESQPGKAATESLHAGVFRGVEHASEIRDLILERLRQFRAAGLGDPDDAADTAAVEPASGIHLPVAAAREVLAEAQALRQTLGQWTQRRE